MGHLEKEIKELHEKTARTRAQFLRAEVQTCFTALEMAKYELLVGNASVAAREVAVVNEGIRTLKRFMPEASAELRTELKTRLKELESILDSIKTELDEKPRYL